MSLLHASNLLKQTALKITPLQYNLFKSVTPQMRNITSLSSKFLLLKI